MDGDQYDIAMTDQALLHQLINDLIPLIQRFPEIPASNIDYNRNFVEILLNQYNAESAVQTHMKELRPEKTLRQGIRYQQHADAAYDSARLKRLLLSLRSDYQPLNDHFGGQFHSIEADLTQLKQSENFSNLAKKLIRISPLLYSASGEALPACYLNSGQQAEPEILQTLYYDTFKAHLSRLIIRLSRRRGYGEIHQFVSNVNNQFIPRELIPATTRYTSNSQAIVERRLVLEEVPPLYAPLRGALAADCSMLTVPYFGILKNTRTFWIYRNAAKNSKPDGYLFIAEITLDNGIIAPYVITINGPRLDQPDCHAIFYLLGSLYHTQHLLVADVRKAPHLINSPRIDNAMASLSGENIKVKLPEGWQAVSSWPINTIAYENFYEATRLTRPKQVKTEKLTLFAPKVEKALHADFYPPKQIKEVKLLNRALLAHYLRISPLKGINDTALQQLLGLNRTHLLHGEKVISLYQGIHFKVDDFKVLKDHFNFTLDDYAQLPSSIRTTSLGDLYCLFQDDPTISAQQWAKVCRKTFNELKTIADNSFEKSDRDDVLQQMASIPDTYVEEYWDTIAPHFKLNNNMIDYFSLRLLVKHFNSDNTLSRFIEFLDNHPAAVEAVKPEDPRWFDFLKRVKTQIPEHSALPKLFQTVFHDHPLNTDISMSLPEVEKRYQAAHALGWDIDASLIDIVMKKRGWC